MDSVKNQDKHPVLFAVLGVVFSALGAISAALVAYVALDVRFSPTGDRLTELLRSDVIDARAEKLELQTQLAKLRAESDRVAKEKGELTAELASLSNAIDKSKSEGNAEPA